MILQLHDLAFYGSRASAVVRSHKIGVGAWDLAGSGSAFNGVFTNVAHKKCITANIKMYNTYLNPRIESHLDRLFAVESINFHPTLTRHLTGNATDSGLLSLWPTIHVHSRTKGACRQGNSLGDNVRNCMGLTYKRFCKILSYKLGHQL